MNVFLKRERENNRMIENNIKVTTNKVKKIYLYRIISLYLKCVISHLSLHVKTLNIWKEFDNNKDHERYFRIKIGLLEIIKFLIIRFQDYGLQELYSKEKIER